MEPEVISTESAESSEPEMVPTAEVVSAAAESSVLEHSGLFNNELCFQFLPIPLYVRRASGDRTSFDEQICNRAL